MLVRIAPGFDYSNTVSAGGVCSPELIPSTFVQLMQRSTEFQAGTGKHTILRGGPGEVFECPVSCKRS